MYDIFISYRRDGGSDSARLIHERLVAKGYKVFFDVETLRSGKFNEKLFSVIEECTDVIVVLPEHGLDRCVDEDDWVRKEVAHAIKLDKNIIPVMLRNFEFPKELPECIKELRFYNGISASNTYFDAYIEKLCSLLLSEGTEISDKDVLPQKKAIEVNDVKYELNFSTDGSSSSRFLYAVAADKAETENYYYNFTQDKWEEVKNAIKEVVAAIIGIQAECVSVKNTSPLGKVLCTPEKATLRDYDRYKAGLFGISVGYIGTNKSKIFDSAVVTIGDNACSVSFFKNGRYIYHNIPEDTPITSLIEDENRLISAIKKLIVVAEHNENVMVSNEFEIKVYSDKSGGFKLRYIV